MSFTYDNTLSDVVSRLRFTVQDTDEDFYEFQDEELQALYDLNNEKFYKTAAELVYRLWVQNNKESNKVEVDGIRVDRSRTDYEALYTQLKLKATKETLTGTVNSSPVWFGGLDRDEFNKVRNDRTSVRPRATQQFVNWNPRHPECSPLDKDYIYFEED